MDRCLKIPLKVKNKLEALGIECDHSNIENKGNFYGNYPYFMLKL